MNMPGFRADASLYKSTKTYSLASQAPGGMRTAGFQRVSPAALPQASHFLCLALQLSCQGGNQTACALWLTLCGGGRPSLFCPPGQTQCGRQCCASNEFCSGGQCIPCPPGRTGCVNDCCAPGRFCCANGTAYRCCHNGDHCCPIGDSVTCCPRNYVCTPTGCALPA